MDYLFRKKINMVELGMQPEPEAYSVLIVTPEYDLYTLFREHLSVHGLGSWYCDSPLRVHEALSLIEPQIILLEIGEGSNTEHSLSAARVIKDVRGHIPVVSIGRHVEANALKRLMEYGVVNHINRGLTRPRDIGYIVKAIL